MEDAAPLDVVHVRLTAAGPRHGGPVPRRATRRSSRRSRGRPVDSVHGDLDARAVHGRADQAGRLRASGRACPKCGAPLAGGEMLKCRYCGALVCSGEYDWVLGEITQLEEWRPAARAPAGARRAAGAGSRRRGRGARGPRVVPVLEVGRGGASPERGADAQVLHAGAARVGRAVGVDAGRERRGGGRVGRRAVRGGRGGRAGPRRRAREVVGWRPCPSTTGTRRSTASSGFCGARYEDSNLEEASDAQAVSVPTRPLVPGLPGDRRLARGFLPRGLAVRELRRAVRSSGRAFESAHFHCRRTVEGAPSATGSQPSSTCGCAATVRTSPRARRTS